jgi:hypothetical protein
MEPRTDTSFFYFHGEYTNFNPFFFKPKKLEVILTEIEIRYSESSPNIDTIYLYQLLAFADYDKTGIDEVKKEFTRIKRQYAKKFFNTNHKDLADDSKKVGEIQNYFVPYAGVAPLSIAWGKLQNENAAVLNITLRMKSMYNRAILPAPLY